MSKAFASQADLADKKITFEQMSPHCWAYTAEGDPNSGVIIGDKYVMVSDCTAMLKCPAAMKIPPMKTDLRCPRTRSAIQPPGRPGLPHASVGGGHCRRSGRIGRGGI